jgi:hypothetical protein
VVDAYVLYEHIDPSLAGVLKVPPLKHHSKRFVPADMIPVNPPLHMALRRPIDPANEVANALYANLKLKRLLEEYADLQKRAQEVLAGLGNPATAPDIRSGTAGQPSRHQLQENLRQRQLAVSRAFPVIARGKTEPGDAGMDRADIPLAAGMESYRVSDSAGAAPPPAGVAGIASESGAVIGLQARNTDASLPWIVEAGFNIIAYLQANKVEAIIYGVLLMATLMGVSSLRRR